MSVKGGSPDLFEGNEILISLSSIRELVDIMEGEDSNIQPIKKNSKIVSILKEKKREIKIIALVLLILGIIVFALLVTTSFIYELHLIDKTVYDDASISFTIDTPGFGQSGIVRIKVTDYFETVYEDMYTYSINIKDLTNNTVFQHDLVLESTSMYQEDLTTSVDFELPEGDYILEIDCDDYREYELDLTYMSGPGTTVVICINVGIILIAFFILTWNLKNLKRKK